MPPPFDSEDHRTPRRQFRIRTLMWAVAGTALLAGIIRDPSARGPAGFLVTFAATVFVILFAFVTLIFLLVGLAEWIADLVARLRDDT